MTQVFADDGMVADRGMLAGEHPHPIPRQASSPSHLAGPLLGSAIMPGKGVRPVRCVGCSRDTLPRQNDGAPLCQRCIEVLAAAGTKLMTSLAGPLLFRAPRWLRRRPETP
jgi:hypothetical protein